MIKTIGTLCGGASSPVYVGHPSFAFPLSLPADTSSLVSQNASASETTYTIFCPAETPPACDLSLEFPFVIVEGPHTVQFHGTVTSALYVYARE